MKKKLIACAIAVGMISFNASANGQGVVNFKGSVIDAPCSIAVDSADQTIDFGQISKAHLDANGISVKKDLDIKLLNCTTATQSSVAVSFSGATDSTNVDELTTAGGTGTVIVISEPGGDKVGFDNTKGNNRTLQDGDNTLRYSAWVKKANGATLTEGAFTAVANFSLSYQ
ncbi:type 1 fimbrial protein [Escherichia coli]|nr:type 1 fimbrial protein [Escherichia coli]EGF7412902.1 type 1 fimbrial protein [Escherichia coli]EGF7454050.1 type 1 fimbrial protein [Escherichia coli]